MSTIDFSRPCPCGKSPNYSYWIYDGYNIPLKRVCDNCEKEAIKKFRPDIMEHYETSEDIESDIDF